MTGAAAPRNDGAACGGNDGRPEAAMTGPLRGKDEGWVFSWASFGYVEEILKPGVDLRLLLGGKIQRHPTHTESVFSVARATLYLFWSCHFETISPYP